MDCVIGYIKCYKYIYFIEFTNLVVQIIGKINEKLTKMSFYGFQISKSKKPSKLKYNI